MDFSDKDSLIRVNPTFARAKKIPVIFIGRIAKQTLKAVFVTGQGSLRAKAKGICFVCGRELTHPVSKKLGVGPVCGQHFWNWDLVGGYGATADQEKLDKIIRNIKFETWIPKSVIKDFSETSEIVEAPESEKPAPVKKNVKIVDDALIISFSYDTKIVQKVKSLSGRKYDKPTKTWSAPNLPQNRQILTNAGFLVPLMPPIIKEPLTLPAHLKNTLKPYQRSGVEYLHQHNGRAILGDDMGLGKTIQALTYIEALPEIENIVIVCPASLKLNWAKEAKMWMTDYNLSIIWGRPKDRGEKLSIKKGLQQLGKFQVVFNKNTKKHLYIINYDILGNQTDKVKNLHTGKTKKVEKIKTGWVDFLTSLELDVVITDECHLYKENATQRTQGVKKLAKEAPKFIALSGTPITNKPIEFFNALNFVAPTQFPSWWKFAQRYCGAKHNGYGWDFSGASNLAELHEMTQNVMIRRLKKEVLTELPPKVRSVVPIVLDNPIAYKRARIKFKELANSDNVPPALALTRIEELKQVAVAGKMKSAIEWVANYIQTGEKLILFCTHKNIIKQLEEHFGKITVTIDGSTPAKNRQKIVDQFQTDKSKLLFLGNIKAAGVGLTLTAASAVCFLEIGFVPGEHDQAEDRAHRIGQEADSINIYYLLADNTIENEIMELLDEKRKVVVAILDGEEVEETSLLADLMQKYKDEE